MAKIAKSIRIDPEVYAYIEKYKGEGFNEKFENIIIYAMKSEKERKLLIENLDSQIASRKKELQKVSNDISKLSGIQYRVNDIMRAVQDIERTLDIKPEPVSQKEPARKIS